MTHWLDRAEATIVAMLEDLVTSPRRGEVLQFLRERRWQLPARLRALHAGATLWFVVVRSALRILPARRRGARWERLQRVVGLRRYCAWYRSLCLYATHAPQLLGPAPRPHPGSTRARGTRVANLVIGTGPGGAVTASVLGDAGLETLVVEEGPSVPPDTPVLSAREIPFYRAGGASFTLGRPPINFVEGSCVGGGSEVNLGIYYRTPEPVLRDWTELAGIDRLEPERVAGWFARIERILGVDFDPPMAQAVVPYLQRGADAVGLQLVKTARCGGAAGNDRGRRRTMANTLLAANGTGGIHLEAGRATRLVPQSDGIAVELATVNGLRRLLAERVFVCAGAVQTPHLLRRSGLGRGLGATLRMNLVVKVVAAFPADVHDGTASVPPLHLCDPTTGTIFGCSVSTPELLALNLACHPDALREAGQRPGRWLIFHASVHAGSAARIASVPGLDEPLVRFALPGRDRELLAREVTKLIRLLLAGGAERVYLNVPGSAPYGSSESAGEFSWRRLRGVRWISSYHLSSSCAMGADGAVDPGGKLGADSRIVLADASVLPTSPRVNPQGTIMMVAWRNAEGVVAGG